MRDMTVSAALRALDGQQIRNRRRQPVLGSDTLKPCLSQLLALCEANYISRLALRL
jgi:hypothetical protein